jgi:hypothetical protein
MTAILGMAFNFSNTELPKMVVSIIRYKEGMVFTQLGQTTKCQSLNQWMPPSYPLLLTTSCSMTKHTIVYQE